MMEFTENLLEHCAVSVNGTSDATLVKTKLALKPLCSRNHDRFSNILLDSIFQVKLKQSYFAARGMGIEG
jgi:lysyl-tRNA synthetase class 2